MRGDSGCLRPGADAQVVFEAARERLLADAGGPTRLAMTMWAYLEDYVRDAGPGPLHGAFERFTSWTRRD